MLICLHSHIFLLELKLSLLNHDFLDFYNKFEIVQSRKIYLPYELKKNSITLQLKEYSKKYYKYGLVAQFDEGEYLLAKSNKYIYENFAEYLSKPFQEYLEYMKVKELSRNSHI